MGGRNLGDDFEDEPQGFGGGLELETGSSVGGMSGGASTYGSDDGISFDDELMGDPHSGPLELDMPVPTPRPSGEQVVAPPHSSPAPISSQAPRISGSHPAASISGTQPAAAPISSPQVSMQAQHQMSAPPQPPTPTPRAAPIPKAPPPPPTAAQVVAKYPVPPEPIWQAPVYFWKVVYRQLELRQDLESLRKRRSPDVPLYEAALQAHDRKTFTTGLAISAAAFVLAMLIFFIPVFLRFLRAD